MDTETLIYICAGLAVTALIGGIIIVYPRWKANSRRRLSQRLSAETKSNFDVVPIKSLMLQTLKTGLPEWANEYPIVISLQRWLNQAYPEALLAKVLGISAGLAVILSLVAFAISGMPVAGLILGGLGAYAPFFMVSRKRAKRRMQFNTQLPDALDFLSRVLRSGQSMSTGLQMMSEELPQPLAGEFRRCYDQHSLGQTIEDALRDMSGRVDSTEFAFFVTAVIIQRQSGGDLGEVLGNISVMIRKRIRLGQSLKSKTAEGRFTGYIMVCFPMVMFVIISMINAQYTNTLLYTSLGHKFLMTAFGLQMGGLWMIKKITAVKV